jgi:hypothetical protein
VAVGYAMAGVVRRGFVLIRKQVEISAGQSPWKSDTIGLYAIPGAGGILHGAGFCDNRATSSK